MSVPEVAFKEVLAGEWFDPHVSAVRLASNEWLHVEPALPPAAGLDSDRLDAGELAVLSLAIANPGAIVVVDDRAARQEAIRAAKSRYWGLRVYYFAQGAGPHTCRQTPT